MKNAKRMRKAIFHREKCKTDVHDLPLAIPGLKFIQNQL
jgi:hypothetical protein